MFKLTIPKVQAWEQLNDPEYAGGLNMEDFHDLLLKAGYTQEVADAAASKRGWDRLQAGVVM